MSAAAEVHIRRATTLDPWLTAIFFVIPLLSCAVPRLTPVLFFIAGLALIGAAMTRGSDWRELLRPNAALLVLLACVAYGLINAIWAVDRSLALAKAAALGAMVLVAFAATSATASLEPKLLRRVALAFVAAMATGAVFLLLELLTDGWLTRMAMSLIDLIRPHHVKHSAMTGERVTYINLSELNQNINLLTFGLWPGLLILGGMESPKRRWLAIAGFFVLLAVPIAISEHDSSQVALVVSVPVLLLAWRWRRPVVGALAVLWVLAFVLVIPADMLAYREGLHLVSWLPTSARARVIIWDTTAERVFAHPWLGIGLDSTAALTAETKDDADQPQGFVYKRSTGHHAHDVFLQTWFELGLVGVVLFALAGVLSALRILLLPQFAQPFAAASFATFFAVAAFAWSMWQTWFMAAIALVPLYLGIGAAFIRSLRMDAAEPEKKAPAMVGGSLAP